MENDQRKNDLNRPGGRDNFKKEILKRELSKKNLLNKDQQKILMGVLMTVAVAVVGTKVEVAVGNGIREAGRMHEVSQNYGVDTTADSKQHLLPRGEEVLLNDMCYESL